MPGFARRPLPLVLTALLGAALVAGTLGALPAAAATASCTEMTTPVYYQINARTGASLLTTWKGEADSASVKYGYTISHGAPFKVSMTPGSGLAGGHRTFKSGDFVFAQSSSDIAAMRQQGYADQGVRFYAATTGSSSCSVTVQRYTLNGKHQVSAPTLPAEVLIRNHWTAQSPTFYAAGTSTASTPKWTVGYTSTPAPSRYSTPPLTSSGASNTDGVFRIAVLPETQMEVGTDTRFADRNRWLVANRKKLDLRYATQVGDLVNWDTPSHDQYVHASQAMSVLEKAGVPWSPTIGNHDAAATCVGGAACPGTNVRIGVRNTSTFNHYFPTDRFRAVRGIYEAGKIDNSYSEFTAEGKTWMLLNLELWPRVGVVNWANWVVKTHPHDNVILETHSYLTSSSAISTGDDYGATSPKYLYDNLVSTNPNIKVVLSGHVGTYGSRVDSRSGNPVTSFLQCFHDNHDNPTRLVTINTKTGSVRGQVYYPKTNRWLPSADKTYTGLKWVN